MNLEQIDKRLSLFPDYLKWALNSPPPMIIHSRRYGVKHMMELFEQTGFLVVDRDDKPNVRRIPPVTFDEWLFDNRHYELVDMAVYMANNNKGLIQTVEKGGITSGYDPHTEEYQWPVLDNEIKWRTAEPEHSHDGSKLNRFFIPSYPGDWSKVDKWGWPLE